MYIPQVNQVTTKNVAKNDNARKGLGKDKDGTELNEQYDKRNKNKLSQNKNGLTPNSRQPIPGNEINMIKINRRFERNLSERSSNEGQNNKSMTSSAVSQRHEAERYMEIIRDQNEVSLRKI